MINAATRLLGLVGSVVGAGVVLNFAGGVFLPWYGLAALVVVVAVLPLVHVVVGNRHDKQ